MQSFPKLCAFVASAALASGCGFERSRNVLVPTDVAKSTATTPASAPLGAPAASLSGTWSEPSHISAHAITSLPAPNSCSAFQFTMTSQSATAASGSFTAQCPGNLTLAGTISGQLGGATIPMLITGVATAPGEASGCPFTLNGTGIMQSPNELRIDYTGTTCLGPVSGSATLRQGSSGTPTPPAPAAPTAPPAAPTASDPLLGCGALVGGEPIRVIECIHDRLNPPHTAEGAFEVTKRVAWAYRNEGVGLLIKNGGENIVSWKGRSFSASRVCLPNGHIYKVLSDVPTTNAPSFQDNDYVDPSLYVPAIDPNS
ncbi:MAG TPA: hypothetical protein VKE96_05840 [Vicinamibacterales bacterium]|nr:hypothetical protein [Vicinamibacterales bacterium]